MPKEPENHHMDPSAWFAGPKAENADEFVETLRRIVQDYYAWRRNYFPDDAAVVDRATRRQNEGFLDAFDDSLQELLGRLKGDFPFYSPRYAAHMLSEQTLPSIAGYFAAMLYNPNNVTAEVAPVTVRLELEAAQMIAKMLGYGEDSWAHLCSGGTVANLEALWVARSVAYLPWVVADVRESLGLHPPDSVPTHPSPTYTLNDFAHIFTQAEQKFGNRPKTMKKVIEAFQRSPHNIAEQGFYEVVNRTGRHPVVIVPESHHYCFDKALDILGLGRESLVRVPVDSDFRMRMDALVETLDHLERSNKLILALVAVLGSTEEGAVDPLDKIVALREAREKHGQSSFWIHADAAYGGYLRTLTIPDRLGLGEPETTVRVDGAVRKVPIHLPHYSACEALERLGECDSITIDPHKLGFVPYPAGAVCFQNNLVKPLLRQEAPYLEEAPKDAETERKSEGIGVYILEGSKPGAAAASVWLSHKLIPLDCTGHGKLIQSLIRDACELHALLEGLPKWSTKDRSVEAVPLCAPGSNIVCYGFKPMGKNVGLDVLNTFNRSIYAHFSLSEGVSERVYMQKFFVSRTTLTKAQYSPGAVSEFLGRLGVSQSSFDEHGVFLLRSVIMNPWYTRAKSHGRHFISELAEELYDVADSVWLRRSEHGLA